MAGKTKAKKKTIKFMGREFDASDLTHTTYSGARLLTVRDNYWAELGSNVKFEAFTSGDLHSLSVTATGCTAQQAATRLAAKCHALFARAGAAMGYEVDA